MGVPLSEGKLNGTRLMCHAHYWEYDVATGGVIVAGVIVTAGSLLSDILTAIADPRVRDG